MKEIAIDSEFIKLSQLMKYADIVGSGGVAKFVIQDGAVSVNGKICTQRGKKIHPGDVVVVHLDGQKTELKVVKGS